MLDKDLCLKGRLSGTRSAEGAQSLKGWKEALDERRRLRKREEESPPWGTGTYRVPYSELLDDGTRE